MIVPKLTPCKTGGLVHLAHDELRDELATLCKQAYVPNAVQLEPPIQNNADSTTENYTQAFCAWVRFPDLVPNSRNLLY